MNQRLYSRMALILIVYSVVLAAAYAVSAQSPQDRPLTSADYDIASVSAPRVASVQGDNAWTRTSTVNAPISTMEPAGVWTGSELIVWGGAASYEEAVQTGGRYNPATDQWQLLPVAGAPSPRQHHVAVWTGKEMIVWGGHNYGAATNTGGRYNPTTNQWTTMSDVNAPPAEPGSSPRQCGYKAIWTGEEMIVWSVCGSAGGRYDPATNQWRTINTVNAPAVPLLVGFSEPALALVWTGTEALVYYPAIDNQMTGGRYDPLTDSWRSMSLSNAPEIAVQPGVVWTGKEMAVYGGDISMFYGPTSGATYNPQTDTWTPIPYHLPGGDTALWTGNEIIVLSGSNDSVADGLNAARYDPVRQQWLMLPHYSCYSNIIVPYGVAVWTGSDILLWGGELCGAYGQAYGGLRFKLPYQYLATYTLDADTYIASGHPAESFGSDPILFSGWDPQYGYGAERVLTHFQFSLPPRFSVTQARTSLYLYAYSKRADVLPTSVHRITSDWNEATATWQNMADRYDPIPVAASAIGTNFDWQTFDVTSLVRSWSAGIPNYGFMFITPATDNRNERVYLAKESNFNYPSLDVAFVDPYYTGDSAAPSAFVMPAAQVQSLDSPLPIQWNGYDVGRGIQSFDVQIRDSAAGAWSDWLTWAVGRQAYFAGTAGHTTCFRVRARDYANNVGAWSVETNCVYFGVGPLAGQVFDQRHQPVPDASRLISPPPVTMTLNLWNGQISAYWSAPQAINIDITQSGYVSPPTAKRTITTAALYDGILQPVDNVLQNSNFEDDLTNGWSITGTLPASRTSLAHSGDYAVSLNPDFSAASGTTSITQAIQIPDQYPHQVLSFLYTLTTTQPASSSFKVSLTAGETITELYVTDQPCAHWCHTWLDLDAWRGQAVTLSFGLTQSSGAVMQVNLDEVTLGSWVTPVVDQASPHRVPAQAATFITVTGENFLAIPPASDYITGPVILLNDTALNTQWVNTTTLTATVPATMPFGIYRLSVQNPGGQQGQWSDAFSVGNTTYLPVMLKNAVGRD